MTRLLSLPVGVGVGAISLINGPGARSSGRNTAVTGRETTFASPSDRVEFELSFAPTVKDRARSQRGAMLSLMSGANAMRIPLIDPDRRVFADLTSTTFSDGSTFSNGSTFSAGTPLVPTQPVAKGSNIMKLVGSAYGAQDLTFGEIVGFVGHFGWYWVLGNVPGSKSNYFIWPRLRKAVTASDYCTLQPVIVARTMPGGFSIARGPLSTEGQSVQLFEVLDEEVDAYYRDW